MMTSKFFYCCLTLLCVALPGYATEWTLTTIEVLPPSQTELVLSVLPVQAGEQFDEQLLAISKRLLVTTAKFETVDFEVLPQSGFLRIRVEPKRYFDEVVWHGKGIPDPDGIERSCLAPSESSNITNERIVKLTECILHRIQGYGYLDASVVIKPSESILDIDVNIGVRYRISKIDFLGREKILEADLLLPLKNRVGGAFLLNEIDEDTKRIFRYYQKEGFYFAQVLKPSVEVDGTRKEVALTWRIQESYSMDIQFTGHRKSRESIYQLMEREQPFPRWFLDEILDEQKNSLIQEGYLASEVTLSKTVLTDGSEKIEIHTRRGRQFDLVEPDWVGVSDRASVRNLYLNVPGLESGAPFEEEEVRRLLAEDFVRFAMSRGYLDARFKDVDFQIDHERAIVKPTIYFTEGDRYTLEKVSIAGAPKEILETQEWKDFQEAVSEGIFFDYVLADRRRIDVQRRLVALGFLDAKVDQSYEKLRGTVVLTVKVQSGPRYKVQRVLVRGAVKTDYKILRHEIVLEPGDFYEDEKIRDSVSLILRLGITRSVDIQPIEKDSKRGIVYALVDISEAARFRVEFGPGFGTADGLRGVFRATYANIGGRARRLSLYAKGSRRLKDENDPSESEYFNPEALPFVQRRVGIEYFEPSLFNLRVDGRLNFTHSKEERNTFGEKNSFSAAMDYRLNRRWIFTSFYELAFSDPFNVLKDSKTTAGDVAPKRFTSIGEIVLIDYLDDSFSPTSGFRTRLEGDFYEARLGGEVNLWQVTVKQEFFQPLYTFRKGRFVGFALSLNSGFTESFDTTRSVPVEKRLKVGGESSVRGFDEGAIRPRLANGNFQDGGNSFFSYMAEVNIPIFSSVDFLLFFDGGAAFIDNRDFRPWKLRYGIGPGLRLNTAVGPLKVGYGFIILPRAGEKMGAFYLGVGAI